MLKVITYNIHLGLKVAEILPWLQKESLDIMCLQEFPENKLHLLKNFFPDYGFEYVKSIRWGYSFGQVTLYNQKKLQLTEVKKILLGKNVIKKVLMGHGEDRHALILTFSYKKKVFTLVNAHLTPVARNRRRIGELKVILDELPTNPILILGDLNYTSLLPRYKLFDFMDSHAFTHESPLAPTHKLLGMPQQTDYIFSRKMQVTNAKILPLTYSDHLPVFANIEPKG